MSFDMPGWLGPYIREMVDIPGSKPEDLLKVLEGYNSKMALLRATPEGRALAAEVQVGLLMRLRVAGLLKETPSA